ncbi:hypothetical protein D3C86_1480960 [compost metagenome]
MPISTMPFSTATPNKAIKPIPALILKGIPRSISANTPPMALMGIAVKIRLACFSELKVKYSSIKISRSDTGTAIMRRPLASRRFSNWPP